MIKQLGFVATALAAGLAAFGGSASATGIAAATHPVGQDDQFGPANVQSLDAVHHLDVVGGACDETVNVLVVQVPLHHVAAGASPENCAGTGASAGGAAQGG
ncbi:hypothetical protein AB0J55_26710 [Amycolatopsis sp. NPDC049688]|uniref:hypothetical protein n=1 Tax=Amycolatopsis sp. NPDC049688 TaxID=3154733 RepID=UPI00343907E0